MTLRDRFLHEVARAGLPVGPGPQQPVAATEIERLPEPVRRYLGFMGAVGRPRDWSVRAGWEGLFRTRPDRHFRACEAWQYTTSLAVARFYLLRMRYGLVIPVIGRDLYLGGTGRMQVRLFDLFTAESGSGPEYNASGLVSYLNDAVLLAPSMLLGPEVLWTAADAESFDVALSDRGRTVAARVVVDAGGAPTEFSTDDRFCFDPDHPAKPMRARWTATIAGWRSVAGRPQPTGGAATWHLPQGRFTYAELHVVPDSLAYNVAPGA